MKTKKKYKNDLTSVPGAACLNCGGWTDIGGMSQHFKSKKPIHGRTGCTCREHASVKWLDAVGDMHRYRYSP